MTPDQENPLIALSNFLDSIFGVPPRGPGDNTDAMGLPVSLLDAPDPSAPSASDYDPFGYGATPTAPDAQKERLREQGYEQPARENPFALSDAEQFALQADRPSPFTTFELSGEGTESRAGPNLSTGGPTSVTSNSNPATIDTIRKIAGLLNSPHLVDHFLAITSISSNALAAAGGFGTTYELFCPGSFLYTERLSSGKNYFAKSVGGSQDPTNPLQGYEVARSDIGFDTFENLSGAGLPSVGTGYNFPGLISGCFIQFDSLDNPIHLVQPGMGVDVGFQRIYVTLFGPSHRWRVTVGRKAKIAIHQSERLVRAQSLAVWDGGGFLDDPALQPVNFHFDFQSSQNGAGSNVITTILSNLDSGAQLAVDGSGFKASGKVLNNGYKILFITGMTLYMNVQGGGCTPYLEIFKGFQKAATGNYLSPLRRGDRAE